MNKQEILEKINYYKTLFKNYDYVLSVFEYDSETVAPKGARDEHDEAYSYVANELFKISKSEDYINTIKEAYEKRHLFNKYYQRLFELNYREMMMNEKVTPEIQYELTLACSNGFSKWLEAKNKNDYSIFEPALNRIVELNRKVIELKAPNAAHPYDVLLDEYEKGNNEIILDEFFNKLKARIVPLLNKIMKSKKEIRRDFLTRKVSIPKQEKTALYCLKYNKFNMDNGALGVVEHPFTTFPSEHDVRVTTHYHENMFISNIYSIIHEGGHGIFGQNEPKYFYEIGLDGNMSSAQHETISRFYENIIGRNNAYVSNLFTKLQKICKKELKDVTPNEFYEAVNIVEPSFIRTEADELSYCLHILIRYEIEKGLIDGTLSTKNLNKVWNDKYTEYLGITPENDKEGILQDVHWSEGLIGYFPSYALGNAYGAQILHKMNQEFDVNEVLKNNGMNTILSWLKKRVFAYGSLLDPNDWIKEITGEELNVDYYLDYLENKYKNLYNL